MGFGAAAKAGTLGKMLQTSKYARAAAGAVVGNLSSYTANRVVGNEAHFSWASVAASAVSATITAGVTPWLADKLPFDYATQNGQSQFDWLGGTVGGVVSASVRHAWLDDEVDYGQVALDAFGNMLGNRLSGQHETQARAYSPGGAGIADRAGTWWDPSTALASLEGGGGRGVQLPESDRAAWAAGNYDRVTMLDTVTAYASPNGWTFWQWNAQADKWLNMDNGRWYAPSPEGKPVVQGWSPVPPVVTTGNPAIQGFTNELTQFINAHAAAHPTALQMAGMSLRSPGYSTGLVTGTVGPTPAPTGRAAVTQYMRDSVIGQNPVGRAYIGAWDFATGIPGQLVDGALGLAYLTTPQGMLEAGTALSQAVQQHGVAGAGQYAMRSTVEGLENWYRQAYFGTEEDRVRAGLQAGTFLIGSMGPARFGRLDGVANSEVRLGLQNLDPTKTSFTQSWVSYQKPGASYNFDTLVESMRTNGWAGKPVDVVRMLDGTLTSIDNTRILAARRAGIEIQANVRAFDELILDANRMDSLSVRGVTPSTWGDAAVLRINSPLQNNVLRNGGVVNWSQRFPNGSIYDPNIWMGN